MAKTYKDKDFLMKKYSELGSTRRVGKFFGVSNACICYWMKKFGLPRNPKLHLYRNNSGKGRLGELFVLGHPHFKKDAVDASLLDDKYPADIFWRNNRVNVKSSHHRRPTFRVKVKRHKVSVYICLYYDDKVSSLIPIEIWIIPANAAPHSSITPSLRNPRSKYHKFKLSLKRGVEFSVEEEEKYNKWFVKKYSKILKGKRGDKDGKRSKSKKGNH